MSSDLSRSLVDAAAEAIDQSDSAFLKLPDEEFVAANPYELSARAAVAAVLETLAASVADQPVELADMTKQGQLYNSGKQYVIDLMRRLAAEVKED